MKSLWNEKEAKPYLNDPLQARVYTSRLLGREPALVLHGGGNTSVKTTAPDIFGDPVEVLYVKGSGWDLATIEAAGFPAVRLSVLQRMAELDSLSDSDMVQGQRSAMLDPNAPNPSVEAVLHAIIPFRFVDHTHADAVVAVSNTSNGAERIREIYGDRVLVVPYVMPGFDLAKAVYRLTRGVDWDRVEGMVLLNHGVFSFAEDARTSYERMIDLVTAAEEYLARNGAVVTDADLSGPPEETDDSLKTLARIRKQVSVQRGSAMIARTDTSNAARAFAGLENVAMITGRGPLTPDHIIRTKRVPVVLAGDTAQSIEAYASDYDAYFRRHDNGTRTRLDPAPRWAVWPGHGTIAFGDTVKDADIVSDIIAHTLPAIRRAEMLGGWQVPGEADLFAVEYWELEQAKLKSSKSRPALQGKIALVTGAASGIGRACVETMRSAGAAVIALDIDPAVDSIYKDRAVLGIWADITQPDSVRAALRAGVETFGGLDIVVNNAGTFPVSEPIEQINEENWDKTLAVNLTGHRNILTACVPFLEQGIDPAVIFVASRNVRAPGPGVAAYSVAKAGVTQLARVAALELAPAGIRVNIIHPDAVFDTGIWTEEVLALRAQHYNMSVPEYKTRNLLHIEVRAGDVAALICAMAGPLFYKVTGAQVPIDGGNERVI